MSGGTHHRIEPSSARERDRTPTSGPGGAAHGARSRLRAAPPITVSNVVPFTRLRRDASAAPSRRHDFAQSGRYGRRRWRADGRVQFLAVLGAVAPRAWRDSSCCSIASRSRWRASASRRSRSRSCSAPTCRRALAATPGPERGAERAGRRSRSGPDRHRDRDREARGRKGSKARRGCATGPGGDAARQAKPVEATTVTTETPPERTEPRASGSRPLPLDTTPAPREPELAATPAEPVRGGTGGPGAPATERRPSPRSRKGAGPEPCPKPRADTPRRSQSRSRSARRSRRRDAPAESQAGPSGPQPPAPSRPRPARAPAPPAASAPAARRPTRIIAGWWRAHLARHKRFPADARGARRPGHRHGQLRARRRRARDPRVAGARHRLCQPSTRKRPGHGAAGFAVSRAARRTRHELHRSGELPHPMIPISPAEENSRCSSP